ncbi:hypothetical protein [Halocatena marina]|uniref:RelE toxin-related domain-containing protein n=1 Tax=Halocatena marina TaxID=2934937 RepID=A0ABD5YM24_9EURY|nr:hypothetical protein [Halocatena marina]
MSKTSGIQKITVSEHALERWFQRSATPGSDPALAWDDAIEIYGHCLEGDEVRYHALSETVLIRKTDTLVTVIAVTDAKWTVRIAVSHLDEMAM